MKIVVLHEKYSNEPIVVRPEAIVAIQKKGVEEENCSSILVGTAIFDVKECIGTVITKIKKAESEEK